MRLPVQAEHKSTYIVDISYKDENEDLVSIKTATWTLTDNKGNIINSRENISLSPGVSSDSIVLKGDDLDYSEGTSRTLTVNAIYDSVTYGNDLPLVEQFIIVIEPAVIVK